MKKLIAFLIIIFALSAEADAKPLKYIYRKHCARQRQLHTQYEKCRPITGSAKIYWNWQKRPRRVLFKFEK